ncbi:MAG: hypothetical protein Q4B64_11550 [Spirochaetales bacterium]|nr:hypothetical protein [Spirochaetales bacterium]
MLTKEEMKQMMIQMAEYLKTFELTDEEISGVLNIAKINAIINGS